MKKISVVLLVVLISFITNAKNLPLIPYPQKVDINEGVFVFPNLIQIYTNAENSVVICESIVNAFKNQEVYCKITDNKKSVVKLIIDKDLEIKDAEYKLIVSKTEITILSKNLEALNYGARTLCQLIKFSKKRNISCLEIKDSPRLKWRGFMLDCSRHFWTPNELKRLIGQLADLKINKLHLHLTDNDGWRLESEAYPKLTTLGVTYKKFPKLSGNFYSISDMKEIIAYAKNRFITIIPEIDMPGHCRAALAAYPELSCRGGKFEVYPQEQGYEGVKRGSEDMLCPAKGATEEFVKTIIEEVCELFPSKYIHLGGDEVNKSIWKTCPDCQALIKKENLKDEDQLQDFFTKKVSAIVQKYGKTMIGWDEINERNAATSKDVVMVWQGTGKDQLQKALDRNIEVVMAPQHGCYFDWGYTGNSTKKVYNWNPVPENISPEKEKLILGAQACLWTERVPHIKDIDKLIFPRLYALAENIWTNKKSHNWNNFLKRLELWYPVLNSSGLNYFVEEDMDAKEFKPGEKPVLLRNARIVTNISTNNPYFKEYSFDGRNNTFFWSGQGVNKSNYFTLVLGEKIGAKMIKIITGDSKDYLEGGNVEVSYDGKRFVKVGVFKKGIATVKLDGKKIKSVKIKVTKTQNSWLIIKEIIVE